MGLPQELQQNDNKLETWNLTDARVGINYDLLWFGRHVIRFTKRWDDHLFLTELKRRWNRRHTAHKTENQNWRVTFVCYHMLYFSSVPACDFCLLTLASQLIIYSAFHMRVFVCTHMGLSNGMTLKLKLKFVQLTVYLTNHFSVASGIRTRLI